MRDDRPRRHLRNYVILILRRMTGWAAQTVLVRLATVSGKLNQIRDAARKLIEARHITGASPNCSARGAVINGAVMLITRPQLKIDVFPVSTYGPDLRL